MTRRTNCRASARLLGGGAQTAPGAPADDADALDDPPEVRELMEELGEDTRGRVGGAAGLFGGVLPRGPLGAVSTLATGVVALTSEALVRAGDLADELLFSTPLGEWLRETQGFGWRWLLVIAAHSTRLR